MLLWSGSVLGLCILWGYLAYRHGPQKALGATILTSYLVPTWATMEVAGNPLDVRVATSIITLILYCFHPAATFPWRLGAIDGCMLMLVMVHVISDSENSGWSWLLPLIAYAEWGIPYVAGRLALQKLDNLEFLGKWGLSIGLLLAAGSIFEAVTWSHPFEWIYGERHYDGIPRDAHRWGMLRAWGNCAHPIFFGMLQLALMPWALRALSNGPDGASSKWTWLFPGVLMAGIACTGSRAALLGGGVVIFVSLLVLVPRSRIPIGVAIPLILAFLAWQEISVLDVVRKWGGERVGKETNKVIVGDEEVVMSGTLSRFHVVKMYQRAVLRGGLLGFGSERTNTFPPNVPIGPEDQSAMKKIRYIDNEYLLLTLRFGWLGVGAFTLAIFLSVFSWYMRANRTFDLERASCVFFANCVLATAIALVTVWMPHDIGFPMLWLMGGASSSFRDQDF